MLVSAATPQPGTPSIPRRLAARYPVAAFLAMAFAVTTTISAVVLLVQREIRLPLGLPLSGALNTLFGVALPAFLVIAALHGRAGVHDLLRRSLRWRVGLRWYAFAVLGLPIASMVCASAIYGPAPLSALGSKWPLLLTLILPDLLLRIVLFNLAEEIGWMGLVQDRLQHRYGPLKACVLAEIPFALWHFPGLLSDTGGALRIALIYLGVLAIAQFFGRIVLMWLYNSTGRSVLLVGMFHAAHNTTINLFPREFFPGLPQDGFLIVSGVVAVAAVLIVIFTRGRLSYRPDRSSQPEDAAPPSAAPVPHA